MAKVSKLANEKLDTAYPAYAHGQAGFDAKQRRFRDAQGNRISKASFIASHYPALPQGGKTKLQPVMTASDVVTTMETAPQSRHFERIEALIGMNRSRELFGHSLKGSEDQHLTSPSQIIQNALNPPVEAWPIPPAIRASMILSEFFMRTEGDLFHAMTLPIELSITDDFHIRSASKDIKREFEELYDVDQLGLTAYMRSIMLSMAIYSNAFSFEADANVEIEGSDEVSPATDSPIAGLALLQPRFTYVGRPVTFWNNITHNVSMTRQFGLVSQSEQQWTRELLQSELPPMAYHALAPNFNQMNQMQPGRWVNLPTGSTQHLYDFKMPDDRYAFPHLQRAFRALTKRKTYDELERSTMEGYKNQLWVFNVGSDKDPGLPAEVQLINSLVGGLAGERTGSLVWRGNLHVEVKAPNSLQGILNQETYMGLTANVFRNLGIILHLIAGESTSRTSTKDVDVRVFIERLKFVQKKLVDFERGFRLRWGPRLLESGKKEPSEAFMRELRKTTVVFQQPMVELEETIKNVITPMMMAGKLSNRTIHESMGLDHDVEVERKQQEKSAGEDELFMPTPVFAQTSTDPSGNTTTHATNKKGGDNLKEQVKGAQEDDDGGREPSDFDPFSFGFSGY